MKTIRLLVLILIAVIGVSHRSDGQASRPLEEQLRLAGAMPQGAMLYLQAGNLSSLMRSWMSSGMRASFYKSKSFAAFESSRIYLKLQDRRKDFEAALGFGLDESRLSEFAGAASAVALYDTGKLELVFVSEQTRERVLRTILFRQAARFQERSADGAAYFVREVTTDSGRLTQQFCFAFSSGRLIVTTTEGLMVRALAAANGGDSLAESVLATARRAEGFAARDLTIWLDQQRLNGNRHFNSYWIHRNVQGPLAQVETGLIDLAITRAGLNEQRWFVRVAGAASPAAVAPEVATELLRYAPADSHLATISSGDATGASRRVIDALLGQLPRTSSPSFAASDFTRSTRTPGDGRVRLTRYSNLDLRFDVDVDDENAPLRPGAGSGSESRDDVAEPAIHEGLERSLAAAGPRALCEIARSGLDQNNLFVRFERAVVVAITGRVDAAEIERTLAEALRKRFIVTGVEPQLAWESDGPVRYVSQSLLDQGAAYAVGDGVVVFGSSRGIVKDALAAAAAVPAPTVNIDQSLLYYAIVRVALARPVFDVLMSKLDGKPPQAPGSHEGESEVRFFSENVSSLLAVTGFRDMTVRRTQSGDVVTESLSYSW